MEGAEAGGSAYGAMGATTRVTGVRVLVADTDLMGVVYNGNFLVWFEKGRTELLRERGLSYAEVERRGYSLPVTEARFRIRRPARYDDLLQIETRVAELKSRMVVFAYRILRDGELLVDGETRHVLTAHADGRPTLFPGWILGAFVGSGPSAR